ncbi:MAG: T9SS type A sorting domain-containing protein [Flavobacteriaceae bacterium]
MKYAIPLLFLFLSVYAQAQFGPQQIISTTTERPYLSLPFDIDDDGLTDVLTVGIEESKMSWYKNLDGSSFGSEIIINDTPVYYLSVDFVDIDNDGDKDILYLSNNPSYIAWLENLDGAGSFGPEQIINEQDFISSVIPTDIDNDGDLDLIAAITDTITGGWIVWFENLDGLGTFSEEILLIQNPSEYLKIMLVDIDNDGFLDIMATDFVYAEGKIFWYKNLGNTTFEPMQIIYQFEWFQSGGTNIIEFQYEDLNNNGKKDLIITSEDENGSFNISWLENIDDLGNFGSPQTLMNFGHQYLFYDIDNDADNDILIWNRFGNILAWKENEDGLGVFGAPQIISTEIDFVADAKAADFDNDGLLDIVSASIADDKLAWYKNTALSISENEINSFKIYPNPTSGILSVESKLPISSISVYTLLGQQIQKTTGNSQIDLSKIKSGIYLLKIEDKNGNSQNHKILKE